LRWQARLSSARRQPSPSGLRASGSSLFLPLSLLSDSLLPWSSFPGGDDWASGGAIRHAFAQPFAGEELPPDPLYRQQGGLAIPSGAASVGNKLLEYGPTWQG